MGIRAVRALRSDSAVVAAFLSFTVSACGGQTGDQPRADRETMIHDICIRAVGCGGSDLAACEHDVLQQSEKHDDAGCKQTADAVLECLVGTDFQCVDGKWLGTQCKPAIDAAKACLDTSAPPPDSAPTCSVGFGASPNGSQCTLDCPSFNAACWPASTGGYSCSCTSGPNQGATFDVWDCGSSELSAKAGVCG